MTTAPSVAESGIVQGGLDTLWAHEASDRLAAYRRGEIKAVALSDVIAKYSAAAQRT